MFINHPGGGARYRHTDRDGTRSRIDGSFLGERHNDRRAVGLGQSVAVVDVVTELAPERLQCGFGDRRAAGIDRPEAGQVLGCHLRVVGPGDEHSDRADRRGRLMFGNGLSRYDRVKTAGQNRGGRGEQRRRDVGNESGDVKERGNREHRTALGQADPVAVDLGGKDNVGVRIHRPLRWPRCA